LAVLFLWVVYSPLSNSQKIRPILSDDTLERPKLVGATALPRPFVPPPDLPADILRLIEALDRRSLDELQRQWLNTIGMIDRVGAEKAATFIVVRAAISAEWARRLALAEANPKAFPWPTTKAPKGKSGLDSGDWHLIGLLSYLGYHVGATNGVTPGVRHQILDLCFEGALPPINGVAYMHDWGPAGTTTRLRKLANELASFARNGKRKRSANLSSAVTDWEADLEYLYRRYYVGKFRFAWPRSD
jgi:hypothetical protein